MPKWVPRAILLFFLGQLLFQFTINALSSLTGFFTTIMISIFLSLAIEPAVNSLSKRGMKRGLATGLVFTGLVVVTSIFLYAIASLVVDQLARLVESTPRYIEQTQDYLNDRFNADINTDSLIAQIDRADSPARKALDNLASNAFTVGTSIIGLIFQMLTISLFTFYLVADAPKLRRSLLRRLPTQRQEFVLQTWELAIQKTGGYIYSRGLLSLISGFLHWIFFESIGLPYAVALAVWVGFVSQFIPIVGTYLAGILPLFIALGQDPKDALFVLIAIVVYQQIENYIFAPRITAKTMDMHPAVAFGAVIVGGSIFGPVGVLLSLPAAAMIQALAILYLQEHEVIESDLTAEPTKKPKKI